jgi:hypothetical protein
MSIAETIYRYVQKMPEKQAAEVLDFVEFLQLKLSKADQSAACADNTELLAFMKKLPVADTPDQIINERFQHLRDEWE